MLNVKSNAKLALIFLLTACHANKEILECLYWENVSVKLDIIRTVSQLIVNSAYPDVLNAMEGLPSASLVKA